jgi:hypothetical protein
MREYYCTEMEFRGHRIHLEGRAPALECVIGCVTLSALREEDWVVFLKAAHDAIVRRLVEIFDESELYHGEDAEEFWAENMPSLTREAVQTLLR